MTSSNILWGGIVAKVTDSTIVSKLITRFEEVAIWRRGQEEAHSLEPTRNPRLKSLIMEVKTLSRGRSFFLETCAARLRRRRAARSPVACSSKCPTWWPPSRGPWCARVLGNSTWNHVVAPSRWRGRGSLWQTGGPSRLRQSCSEDDKKQVDHNKLWKWTRISQTHLLD